MSSAPVWSFSINLRLLATLAINSFAKFSKFTIHHSLLIPPNKVQCLFSEPIQLCSRCRYFSRIYPRFLRLGFLKQIHFSSPVTIRRNTDFLSCRRSNVSQIVFRFSICMSFNSCETYFPHCLLIFPIAFERWEIVCSATINIFAICFCQTQSVIFIQFFLHSPSLNFFGLPHCSFRTSKQYHYLSIVEIIFCMLLPIDNDHHKPWQAFDAHSAVLFSKWKQKNNVFRKSLFSNINCDIFITFKNIMTSPQTDTPNIICIKLNIIYHPSVGS